jgi:hypothetical protein
MMNSKASDPFKAAINNICQKQMIVFADAYPSIKYISSRDAKEIIKHLGEKIATPLRVDRP